MKMGTGPNLEEYGDSSQETVSCVSYERGNSERREFHLHSDLIQTLQRVHLKPCKFGHLECSI